jgi:hypothetical protein
MINTTNGTAGPMINRRIDPALDKRRLVWFFAGLIIFYAGVLLIARPELNGGEAELAKIALGVMLAPTVGAILACVFGPGLIRFGLPSWWLLASFLPAVVVLLITMIAALEWAGPVVLLLLRCRGGSGFHRERVSAR